MVIKKYIKGIAIVVLVLSLISAAFGITIIQPVTPDANTIVTNFTGDAGRFFEVTTNNTANFTWKINGSDILTGVQGKENITRSNYTNLSAGKGFWNITVIAANTSNPGDIITQTWNWNVIDPIDNTPPPGVTGLTVSGKGATWINWSWINPPNPPNTDFNHTFVKVNNSFQKNVSNTTSFYNHTGLTSGSLYTISLQTVDTSGNMNQTPITDPQFTFNTPAGPSVIISHPFGSINFSSVTGEGNTSAATTSSPGALNKLKNVSNIINISTSATTTGNITISLNYNSALLSSLGYIPSDVDLYHWNSSSWENITNLRESAKISGIVSSPLSSIFMAAVNDTIPPANITGLNSTSGFTWIKWTWAPVLGDFDHTEVYLNGSFVMNTTSNNYNTSSNYTLPQKTTHNISLRPADASGNIGNWTNGTASTIAPPPIISKFSPNWTTNDITGFLTQTFTIKLENQTANISWKIGGVEKQNNTFITQNSFVNFNFTPTALGPHNLTVNAVNENGTSDPVHWNFTVRPKTYAKGNRIWDGCKPDDFSLTYTWNPMSFSGFYYDAKDNVGSEELKITMTGYNSRSIPKNNVIYSTKPESVSFKYSAFGKYDVIGFMADKYFAGYNNQTNPSSPQPSTTFTGLSALADGKLHKVLIDDDTKRTISIGSTLTLQEGYVLKATDIDMGGRTMMLILLKDGNEVESEFLAANETFLYTPPGSDVPTIFVRFDRVFSGAEMQMAQILGLFQISETATTVQTGNRFRDMEVTSVNKDGIVMTNSNSIGLSKGNTESLMGDMKIITANNDSCVRFALSVEKTGNFEVRSTVYDGSDPSTVTEWTPYNFGMNIGKTSIGFYYNLDDGIGTEKLTLSPSPGSSRTIPDTNLEYTTIPQEVKFTYNPSSTTGFGKYQVVGFMAEKYFAGYTNQTHPSNPVGRITTVDGLSALADGKLHKVLIDDDTKRTISIGSTITLQDGYVLKATDIDMGARTMMLILLKDGNEVESEFLAANETFLYTPPGSDVPTIFVRFDRVFSGAEMQMAQILGLFQISGNPLSIKIGDHFGKMEVTEVNKDRIKMSNDGSIGLDKGRNEPLMGNIRLKVADTDSALRFYFAVDVTPDMVANQLVIDAPQKAMAGDEIKIKVMAGGNPVDNASVTLDTDIGKTDKSGLLNYTLPKTLKGMYNFTATKIGYEKATRSIEIEKYIDLRLTLDAPAKTVQFEPISIKVLYNGSAMNGATVKFDNQTLGVTDSTGILNYTLQTTGTHVLSASKTSYVSVSRDIDIVAPFSDFKAIDLNVSPVSVFTDDNLVIKANITNAGNKKDTRPVELMMNGTAVSNVTLTLGPGDKKEINFTRNESKAGNYTFEIAGQKGVYEVKDKPLNLLLIGGILTLIGIGAIYVLTAKGMINIDLLKEKFNSLFKSVKK